MRSSSCTPFSLAAICACRSAMFWSGLRAGQRPEARISRASRSRNSPLPTSWKLVNSTPSSSTVRESGGIEPGVVPPMSAWWPREPTKNRMSWPARSNTGVMTVTSGRCVPPWYGSLTT
ncbi:Uncharacterised protein [Bordetella pertussis]|nr:Uncharacterised protein [Bordetella pertussis]CFW15197.1 Uncharacterised protein [Bordetella pertussis]